MSISYSTIAIGASIAAGRQPDAYYNMDSLPVVTQVFGAGPPCGRARRAHACMQTRMPEACGCERKPRRAHACMHVCMCVRKACGCERAS
jgi:hypothetical protein